MLLRRISILVVCVSAVIMIVYRPNTRADNRRGYPILCMLEYGIDQDQTYLFDSTYSTEGELEAMRAMCAVAQADPGCTKEGEVDNYGEYACCETCPPQPE